MGDSRYGRAWKRAECPWCGRSTAFSGGPLFRSGQVTKDRVFRAHHRPGTKTRCEPGRAG